jgi:hypothetical protein
MCDQDNSDIEQDANDDNNQDDFLNENDQHIDLINIASLQCKQSQRDDDNNVLCSSKKSPFWLTLEDILGMF